jgi:hypothetical protein
VDVEAWLQALGLDQYAQAFRASDVDARVLPGLTADDLKEIGVASVGHRRLMLQAIAALGTLSASPASAAIEASVASVVHPLSQAERRQLTVMFIDLVGSTALSARLDPEEMRAVLLAYQDAGTAEIKRYGGHVAKLMGDGVLAYFGWPKADEDEAERAVRAGLMVVGDMIGEGAAQEEAVVGETPNLAARLQKTAPPRSDRHSAEPDHGSGEVDEAGEVDGSSVVAGGEAAEVLEPVEASFDAVAVLAGGGVMRDSNLAGAVGRDHRLGARFCDGRT